MGQQTEDSSGCLQLILIVEEMEEHGDGNDIDLPGTQPCH